MINEQEIVAAVAALLLLPTIFYIWWPHWHRNEPRHLNGWWHDPLWPRTQRSPSVWRQACDHSREQSEARRNG